MRGEPGPDARSTNLVLVLLFIVSIVIVIYFLIAISILFLFLIPTLILGPVARSGAVRQGDPCRA